MARRGKWLAPQLDERVQILLPIQTESEDGGLSQNYLLLATRWARCRPISYTAYRRFSSTDGFESLSHEFLFRYNAVEHLGPAFTIAFSVGYKRIAGLHPLTQDIFLMMEENASYKGKMFRVRKVMNSEENDEYLSVYVEEMEEIGTGAITSTIT